ncbi:MAG: hypothetical protein WCJ56_00625 [bacterium]
MESITLDKVTLEIIQDESPDNPREWDNLGIMACWHNRYTLGEPHNYATPHDFTQEINERTAVILPLYLFDHSGLTISTTSTLFHACDPDGWDWGQIGYIYVPRETVRKEYGVKHITRRMIDRVADLLRGEVETYNHYMQGDVYGFVLNDRQTGETIVSCWGFFGVDPICNGMADHFPTEYRDDILAHFYQRVA